MCYPEDHGVKMKDSELLRNFKQYFTICSQDIGKIKNPPNRRLSSAFKRHRKDLNNTFSKGHYLGLLFEHYVTPLLIKSAHELKYVKWVIPAGNYTKRLKKQRRKNRLSYTKKGELVILDSNVPAAEFDGIIKLKNEIVLIEQKYNLPKANARTAIKRLLTRLKLFSAAYDTEPIILLIVPSNIKNFDLRDRFEAKEQFSILEVDHFDQFRKMYEKKRFPKTRIPLSNNSSKIRPPHEVFPKIIDFQWNRSLLKENILSSLDNKVVPKEFFKKYQKSIDLVNKVPLGKIESKFQIHKMIHDPYSIWKEYSKQKVPIVLFIKFREPRVYPEIVAFKNEGKSRIKRMRRSIYDFNSRKFSSGKLNVAERTLTYSLARKTAENAKDPPINKEFLERLLYFCRTLTKYCIRNSEFWYTYEKPLLDQL